MRANGQAGRVCDRALRNLFYRLNDRRRSDCGNGDSIRDENVRAKWARVSDSLLSLLDSFYADSYTAAVIAVFTLEIIRKTEQRGVIRAGIRFA